MRRLLPALLAAANLFVPGCGNEPSKSSAGSGEGSSATDSSDSLSDEGGDSQTGQGKDSGSSKDSTTDSVCGELNVNFQLQTPTVMLLIDQSGSMEESFGNVDRWEAVKNTLLGQPNGTVTRLDSQVRFGLNLYTSHGGYEGGKCPMLTGVDPAINNYDAIKNVFDNNAPENDTPTAESILQVVTLLKQDQDPSKKIIVLATDGEPDTCEVPNPQQGQEESIAAAQTAYKEHFPVFIIGVGDDVGEDHLRQMANAGQGFPIDDPKGADFYRGLDPQSLVQAFEDIISGARDCVLDLEGEVQQGMEDQCKVTIDGEPVNYNDPDGWRLNSPSKLELVGGACENIKTGEKELLVSCPCDAFGPI